MTDPREIAERYEREGFEYVFPDEWGALARAFLAQKEELEAAEFRLRGQREELSVYRDALEVSESELTEQREKVAVQQPVIDAARKIERIYEGLRTDTNDGEFALWGEDNLVAALHELNPALRALDREKR